MRQRIDRLLSLLRQGQAMLISGYPNIFYYSGFTSEDAYLIISKDRLIIITDSRYFTQAKQEAPDFELADISKGWDKIFEAVSENEICFEENNITVAALDKIKEKAKDKRFIKACGKADKPRRRKDKTELELIASAEEIGDMAFSHILEFIRPGMRESEIALELEIYMKKQGASALSFTTIAASGERSAMPHGAASDKTVKKGELLTLDFGCVYHGYCSDMTRTVVLGKPDSKQKEIYDTVLRAQTAAIDGIYEGILCSDADKIAREIIKSAGYGDCFTHSLGHSVGVEIHENPLFSPKSTDTLEDGNVLSVEPGIYIEGWGGVRIEDLIAVSDGKIVNLTHSPKELIVI
jgi:Xaa-Pro aminopeptidase